MPKSKCYALIWAPLFLWGCVNPQVEEYKQQCVAGARETEKTTQGKSVAQWSKTYTASPDTKPAYMRGLSNSARSCAEVLNASPDFQHEVGFLTGFADSIEKEYMGKEKARFFKKADGRKFCTGQQKNPMDSEIVSFFYYPNAMPLDDCIYMLAPNAMPLTVMQTLPEGVLVTARWTQVPGKIMFIYNDNKKENMLADGAGVAPGYFVYAGKYPYVSITGHRSVYAFRRIDNPSEGNAFFSGY